MKDFGSLIWFVFQWSAQKKTCDQYRDRHAQNNAEASADSLHETALFL